MTPKFRLGAQELIGLGVVGATLGAVMCGAAGAQLPAHAAFGAAAGAIAVPAVITFRWSSLRRAAASLRQPIRTPGRQS